MIPSLVFALACAPKPEPVRRAVTLEPSAPASVAAPAVPEAEPPPEHQGQRQVRGPGLIRPPVERWRVSLGGPITEPAAVHDGALWVVAADQVARVEADGTVRFQSDVDAVGAVALTPEGVVVGARDGALLALSPSTGKPTLAWPGTARPRGSAVLLDQQVGWLTSDGALRLSGGKVHAVALTAAGGPSSDGRRAWFQSMDGELWAVDADGPAWRVRVPGPGLGRPVVDEDHVYAAWDRYQGEPGGVQAVDRETGTRRWILPTSSPPAAGLALGRLLLVPTAAGAVLAVEPDSGQIAWEAVLGSDEPTTAPLVAGSSAWIGDAGGRLYRLDLDDGGVAWSFDLGAAVTGDPVLLGSLLVVGLASGDLVALEARP